MHKIVMVYEIHVFKELNIHIYNRSIYSNVDLYLNVKQQKNFSHNN